MSTCDISKHERCTCISLFEGFMTKFHELPEQPSYMMDDGAFLLVCVGPTIKIVGVLLTNSPFYP